MMLLVNIVNMIVYMFYCFTMVMKPIHIAISLAVI